MVVSKQIKSKSELSVSVVIPNWNGVYLMKKHLQNVINAAPEAEIIIADDLSTDGSVEYLKQNFPKVITVRRDKREGFAANVNTGVVQAHGDIIILLNTDVEPEKNFLQYLLPHFASSDTFAVGCLEKSHEGDAIVMRGRGIGSWQKGFYIHSKGDTESASTAWVSGGSGAFRKSMWDALGGMDTLYNPFYWEDIDLSYRARKAGWKTLFEKRSVVHHYHEEGKIKREYTPTDVKRIVYRNQFIFIWKNLTDLPIILAHIFWTPVRLLQALFRQDLLMIHGYALAVLRLPKILRTRIRVTVPAVVNDSDL